MRAPVPHEVTRLRTWLPAGDPDIIEDDTRVWGCGLDVVFVLGDAGEDDGMIGLIRCFPSPFLSKRLATMLVFLTIPGSYGSVFPCEPHVVGPDECFGSRS